MLGAHRWLFWTTPRGYHLKSAKNREICEYMGHSHNMPQQREKSDSILPLKAKILLLPFQWLCKMHMWHNSIYLHLLWGSLHHESRSADLWWQLHFDLKLHHLRIKFSMNLHHKDSGFMTHTRASYALLFQGSNFYCMQLSSLCWKEKQLTVEMHISAEQFFVCLFFKMNFKSRQIKNLTIENYKCEEDQRYNGTVCTLQQVHHYVCFQVFKGVQIILRI